MLQQFIAVALPIVIAFAIASWLQNKRFDDLRGDLRDLRADINARFGEVIRRLDSIDATLKIHGEKIAGLEERTSPLRGRG